MKISSRTLMLSLAAVGVWTVGCQSSSDSAKANKAKAPATSTKADKGDLHDHPEAGPHGGVLAEWGEEEFHAEFTVDHKTNEATVYILDGSAKKVKPIKSASITLALKLQPPVTVTLTAKPLDGETGGASSRFVGKHDALGKDQKLSGTISADVNGKPYAGDFNQDEKKKPGEK